jgi:hypothetical protein
MPKHDPQTPIREANDLDEGILEEAAWIIIEQYGWTPTPQLLMYLMRHIHESSNRNNKGFIKTTDDV